MAHRPKLLFLSALLATALALPLDGLAQRGRGGGGGGGGGGAPSAGRSSGGSIGRSSGGSIGRSSGSSIGRSVQSRPAPAPSRPSVGSSRGVSPAPARPSVTSPRVSPSPRVAPSPSPSTGRYAPATPSRGSYPSPSVSPRVDTGRGSSLERGTRLSPTPTPSPSPSRGYEAPLRGLDDAYRGPATGRIGGSSLDTGRGYEDSLRGRPSTSTALPTRGASPVLDDLGRASAPQQRRTPFPSLYRPAPETLSGARITAMERLESQRAQQRLGGEGLSTSRVQPSEIRERYSRSAADPADVGRGASRAPSAGPASGRDTTLSRGRLEGLSRYRDSARAEAPIGSSRGERAPSTRGATRERASGERPSGERASRQREAAASATSARDRYAAARQAGSDDARRARATARAAGIAADAAFRTAVGATGVVPGVPSAASSSVGWSNDLAGYTPAQVNTCNWYWNCWYPSFCGGWWGSGWWWGACWGWGWGWGWNWGWGCRWGGWGWWDPWWYYPWGGWAYPIYSPVVYAYSPPVVYQTVYYDDPAAQGAYADPAPVEVAPQEQAVRSDAASLMGRATAEYLNLGDRAFLEGAYGKAVKYYAKAVEYSPNDGVLYLVLSDALFATGDYHYAAYALRRALELAPELAEVVVDKRRFYGDPADFDRQLAQLEAYLSDHFLDDDARLVLAANYLFGGQPERCVELLENAFSNEVKASPAGQALLASARNALAAR